jgi:hypothetical protein
MSSYPFIFHDVLMEFFYIDTILIVNHSIMFLHTHKHTSGFLEEFGSVVSYSTKPLNIQSLSLNSLCNIVFISKILIFVFL